MRKLILIPFLICILINNINAQSGVRDSTIHFPFFNIGYGIYGTGGDLAKSFGTSSIFSGSILYKTTKNYLLGISGGFIFGDKIKDQNILKNISTGSGQIIGLDGLFADVRIFERGYHFSATFGKVFKFKKPNPNSGIMVTVGSGFIQHKIRYEDIGHNVPQLDKDYLKGYDHLTNGLEIHEFIGYVYFGNRQLVNFFGGFEFIQGFTVNRRDYNFDTGTKDKKNRIDLLNGFKIGWVLPLYKKKPSAYYLY